MKRNCAKKENLTRQTKIKQKVFNPFMDQTDIDDPSVNEIGNQTTFETMQEVFDPFMAQTNTNSKRK